MEKVIIFVLMIFSLGLQAQDLQSCIQQAELYGVDLSTAKIDEGCKSIIKNQATIAASDTTSDGLIQAYGDSNIIHVLYHNLDINGVPSLTLSGLISGHYTQLHKIKAIDIDGVNEMIYALNETKKGVLGVVSVEANKEGALAAMTKLYTDEIIGAVNIRTDRNNKELYVVSKTWIKVFNIDAHHKSSKPEQSIALKRSINGNNTTLVDIKDIVIVDNKIYVLDGGRILEFPRVAFEADMEPTKILTNNLPLTAVSLEYLNGSLVIQKLDKSELKISLK